MKIAFLLVAAVFVAAAGFIFWSYRAFDKDIRAEIARLQAIPGASTTLVTRQMIDELPAPAQKYARWTGLEGMAIPAQVVIHQKGRIRSSAEANWMELEAAETFATGQPGFVWQAWFPNRRMPVVMGRDEYFDGLGSISMKMGAVLPVADEYGPELGPAGLMRYLNEMMWFPAALFSPGVTITSRDDTSFDVAIAGGDLTAKATLFIDDDGRLTNFRAMRFNTSTGLEGLWETPMTGYGTFEGLRLPVKGSAVWKLGSGDFTYIELEVTDIVYD